MQREHEVELAACLLLERSQPPVYREEPGERQTLPSEVAEVAGACCAGEPDSAPRLRQPEKGPADDQHDRRGEASGHPSTPPAPPACASREDLLCQRPNRLVHGPDGDAMNALRRGRDPRGIR